MSKTPCIKGFVTNEGRTLYDFEALGNTPQVIKNLPNVKAEVGHILRVDSVDEDGRISSVSTIPPEESSGSGEQGFSPVVEVSEISNGHRITITDANGTKTVDVMDGADGSSGQDGQDGYTPQKGIDYFTEADKQEIVQAVYAQIADGNGVSY